MLEFIINKFLRQDPNARKYLAALDSKTVAIKCKDFPSKNLFCIFGSDYVQITSTAPKEIAATITGSLTAFVTLAINREDTDFRAANFTINGDLFTVQQMQHLLLQLDIDWEEELSHYTGDIIAHQAVFLFKKLKKFHTTTKTSLEEMITEYLQEESGLLPTAYEIDEFSNAVDELRLDVDRLTAKVSAYENN